ncbi:hypothetical protein HIO72_06405 [Halomonas sp. PA5]|nr:hypothetical protein HIO72_06405 [Halomonas sp. PA5]
MNIHRLAASGLVGYLYRYALSCLLLWLVGAFAPASAADDLMSEREALNQRLQQLQAAEGDPPRAAPAAGYPRLQQLQDRLAEVNAQLLNAQTLPERAQQAIAAAMQSAELSRRAVDELESQGLAADEPRLVRRRVERRLAEFELLYHQRELSTNTRLRELAQQRRDLLSRQVEAQETLLAMLQSVIDRQRRLLSEQAIADAARDDPLIAAGHPVLARAQEINRDLSLELLRATDRTNSLVRLGIETRRELEQVRQIQRSLNEQIETIRGSLLLSRILREQRQSLPQVDMRRDLQEEIAVARATARTLATARAPCTDRRAVAAAGRGPALDAASHPCQVGATARADRPLQQRQPDAYAQGGTAQCSAGGAWAAGDGRRRHCCGGGRRGVGRSVRRGTLASGPGLGSHRLGTTLVGA